MITNQDVLQAKVMVDLARVELDKRLEFYYQARGQKWLQEHGIKLGDIVTDEHRGDRRMVVIGASNGILAICRWIRKDGKMGIDDHGCYDPVLVGHHEGELPPPVWR